MDITHIIGEITNTNVLHLKYKVESRQTSTPTPLEVAMSLVFGPNVPYLGRSPSGTSYRTPFKSPIFTCSLSLLWNSATIFN